MKTYRHLWEQFISSENWALAYERAKKGKKDWHSVQRFTPARLESLRQAIIAGQYHTSNYRLKVIYEPKERTIYKLPFTDRIVHHAVMNILRPILTPLLTDTCYACVEERGPHKASLKCAEYVRKYKYCLKCDIRKFYPSIRHDLLIKAMRRIIKDITFMNVVEEIIRSFPGDRNVPIGNYTSQWLGNFFLVSMDNYIKHELHLGKYIRYCDDFLMFSNDKKELQKARELIHSFIRVNLDLDFSKSDIFDVRQGVDFCGFRHFKGYVLMRKSSAHRWLRRTVTREALPSFYGQSIKCNGYHLRLAMLKKVPAGWIRERKLLIYGARAKSIFDYKEAA